MCLSPEGKPDQSFNLYSRRPGCYVSFSQHNLYSGCAGLTVDRAWILRLRLSLWRRTDTRSGIDEWKEDAAARGALARRRNRHPRESRQRVVELAPVVSPPLYKVRETGSFKIGGKNRTKSTEKWANPLLAMLYLSSVNANVDGVMLCSTASRKTISAIHQVLPCGRAFVEESRWKSVTVGVQKPRFLRGRTEKLSTSLFRVRAWTIDGTSADSEQADPNAQAVAESFWPAFFESERLRAQQPPLS